MRIVCFQKSIGRVVGVGIGNALYNMAIALIGIRKVSVNERFRFVNPGRLIE